MPSLRILTWSGVNLMTPSWAWNSSKFERNLLSANKTKGKVKKNQRNSAWWSFTLNFCLVKLTPRSGPLNTYLEWYSSAAAPTVVVVSVLALYSDNLSLNPTGFCFFVQYLEKTNINEKTIGQKCLTSNIKKIYVWILNLNIFLPPSTTISSHLRKEIQPRTTVITE